ncbi:MAG: hypothetical protein WCT77_10375, partial [Bacteroidota bacterium]
MKRIYSSIFVILIAFAFLVSQAYAQTWQNKPDEELTRDEATAKILDWQTRVNALDEQYKALDQSVEALKTELDNTVKGIKNCNESLYTILGLTPADVESFRQKLGILEGKIRDMKRLPDDVLADKQTEVKALEAELNGLRGMKAAILPEFYNRIVTDARDIKGLYREKLVKSYTVGTWAKDKDCLWNIAGKID